MNPSFDTVTIVGVGLLGGSLGLALKKRGLARLVRGVGRRESSLDAAKVHGAVDETFLDIRRAVPGSDLVVLCTPAGAVAEHLDAVRETCDDECVVTDVASTKGRICRYAATTWRSPRRFVGSHPMAGSEKFGAEHARADLFDGAATFVEETDNVDADAHAAICGLWKGLGSRVIPIDPEIHDAFVARTSHVPHIAAAAISRLVAGLENVEPFIGNGFRDTTRVADGRPELWRDVCLTNAASIARVLRELVQELDGVCQAVESGDGTRLEAFFEEGRAARRRSTGE